MNNKALVQNRKIESFPQTEDVRRRPVSGIQRHNAMIGRVLRQRGFVRVGAHRANFWNTVTYECTI